MYIEPVKRCANCNKPLKPGKSKYCCNACRIEVTSARSISGRNRRAKKRASALAEINAAARSEGLTYGQYVAKYDHGKGVSHGQN